MAELDGLGYVFFPTALSEGWSGVLHGAYRRWFGADGRTWIEVVGTDSEPVESAASLVAEVDDTLVILIDGEEPLTVCMTVHSPTTAEIAVTCGREWARGPAAIESLPDAVHEH